MDPEVIKYYRRMLRTGFEYAGSFENPSIFLDSVTEHIPVCGQVGQDYLHVYISVRDNVMDEIKYLCTCDPTANVVVEILCFMVKGKTLQEARALTEKEFAQVLGTHDEEYLKKAKSALELLNRGINRFEGQ
jgi:NifU-like protein involved in Fe-S cluster formation